MMAAVSPFADEWLAWLLLADLDLDLLIHDLDLEWYLDLEWDLDCKWDLDLLVGSESLDESDKSKLLSLLGGPGGGPVLGIVSGDSWGSFWVLLLPQIGWSTVLHSFSMLSEPGGFPSSTVGVNPLLVAHMNVRTICSDWMKVPIATAFIPFAPTRTSSIFNRILRLASLAVMIPCPSIT
jgi:hypothetical protein